MSIAASAFPLARVANGGADSIEEKRPETSVRGWPVSRFLVDGRFPESVSAGRAAEERGVTVREMSDGDVTPVWFHELSRMWKHEPAVIAGVTGHGPLFVLERFAWDHGLRVLVRVEHRHASNGLMTHKLSGPTRLVSAMAELLTGENWAVSMGAALTQCSLEPGAQTDLVVNGWESSDDTDPLFSWVIAPASKTTDTMPSRG